MATPNMNLILPTPGLTQALGVAPVGASWMELQNAAFLALDSHSHRPGSGAPIGAASISIDADLPFNSKNVTQLRSARFAPIALASLGVSDIGALIVSGADLYYIDTSGNVVRITSAGGVAGTPGSIGGLASPAAVTYTPASKLFAFTSSSGFVANMSCGPVAIGDATVSGGKAATIGVPAGLAANYNLTLPGALPAGTSLVAVGATGIMSTPLTSPALPASTSLLNVSPAGVLAAVPGLVLSASSGAYSSVPDALTAVTNLSVSITTSGGPVWVGLQHDGNTTPTLEGYLYNTSASGGFILYFFRGATQISAQEVVPQSGNGRLPPGAFSFFDVPPAGTYTYSVKVLNVTAGGTMVVHYCVLGVYGL